MNDRRERPEKFAAIAFDLDGTLVDTLPAMHAAFNGVLGPIIGRAIPPEEIVSRLGPKAVEIMRFYAPDKADGIIHAYVDYYLSVHLDHSLLYAGVAETIGELARRGCKLGVVTSKKRITAIPTLEHFGLLRHFHSVVAEEDVAVLKPDPEPVLKVAQALGVAPRALLIVGDNPTDIAAAHAAGATAGAATWGYYGEKVARGADLVFATPGEVLAVCAM